MKYTAIGSQVYVRHGKPHIRIHTVEGETLDVAAPLAVLDGIRQVCAEIQDPKVRAALTAPSTVEAVMA